MNDGHIKLFPTLPRTPEQVVDFIGPHYRKQYLRGYLGLKADPVDVRYLVKVSDLIDAFEGLQGSTIRASIDVEAIAWAYKAMTEYGEQDHPMMDRLGAALGGLGHD